MYTIILPDLVGIWNSKGRKSALYCLDQILATFFSPVCLAHYYIYIFLLKGYMSLIGSFCVVQ